MLFLTGAWLGRRALLTGTALALPPRARRVALGVALAIVAAGLLMRLTWYGFTPWRAPFGELYWIEGKQDLSVPRLLHALALALLVATLVPRQARWMRGVVADAVARIGQYSLEVFCLGLFLSWIGTTAFRLAAPHGPAFVALDILLIGAGGVGLAAFARMLDRRRAGRRIVARA
jgi:hypothetical protein